MICVQLLKVDTKVHGTLKEYIVHMRKGFQTTNQTKESKRMEGKEPAAMLWYLLEEQRFGRDGESGKEMCTYVRNACILRLTTLLSMLGDRRNLRKAI